MNTSSLFSLLALALSSASTFALQTDQRISGSYLEVRSCDVYTGPCFANAEMGLTGKEGMMVWSVGQGAWHGTDLSGLNVIAIVCTDKTLGDLHYQPRAGKAL